MRTTLTLDDDVTALLEQVQRQQKATFKEVINSALRRGLLSMQVVPKPRSPFRTRTLNVGRCYVPLESISEALAIAEGEDHK